MELPQSPDSVLDAGDDTAATAPRYKDSAATAANADGWRMLVTLLNRLEAGAQIRAGNHIKVRVQLSDHFNEDPFVPRCFQPVLQAYVDGNWQDVLHYKEFPALHGKAGQDFVPTLVMLNDTTAEVILLARAVGFIDFQTGKRKTKIATMFRIRFYEVAYNVKEPKGDGSRQPKLPGGIEAVTAETFGIGAFIDRPPTAEERDARAAVNAAQQALKDESGRSSKRAKRATKTAGGDGAGSVAGDIAAVAAEVEAELEPELKAEERDEQPFPQQSSKQPARSNEATIRFASHTLQLLAAMGGICAKLNTGADAEAIDYHLSSLKKIMTRVSEEAKLLADLDMMDLLALAEDLGFKMADPAFGGHV
mmetsp:Transcript_27182/g.59710  ORF Transcript_27182/g.59710 Transcript_27182/m.59710 type:complete len:364 (+) Transcript_27182:530-1621(+)